MPADRRTVAFLPTASGSAEYAAHFGKYLRGLDPSVEVVNVPIYRGRDNRRQKNLAAILGAGMIYLGGGVTNNLAADAARVAGRVGAARCGRERRRDRGHRRRGVLFRDARARHARQYIGALPALGWLANTVIDTGFDPQNDIALRRLMSLPDGDLGLGIPPKTALRGCRDGATEIIGDGQIAAFRKR